MKGIHKVVVRGRRVQFTITLERNITVLLGDSATGKTTLISMPQDYENEGRQSGVLVICDRICHVIWGNRWEKQLENIQESIVFADEGNAFSNKECESDKSYGRKISYAACQYFDEASVRAVQHAL